MCGSDSFELNNRKLVPAQIRTLPTLLLLVLMGGLLSACQTNRAVEASRESSQAVSTGDLTTALALAEEVVETTRAQLGAADPNVATALENSASVALAMAQYEKAESYYLQALKIREDDYLHGNDLELAQLYSAIASLYQQQGLYSRALDTIGKGLKLKVSDKAYRVMTYTQRASILLSQSRLSDAGSDLHRADELSITDTFVRSEEGKILRVSVLEGLGRLHSLQRDEAVARKYHRQALSLAQQLSGNPLVEASVLNNLAQFESGYGNYGDARKNFRAAVAVYEQVLGRNHPDLAVILSNLAQTELYLEGFQAANRLADRASPSLSDTMVQGVSDLLNRYRLRVDMPTPRVT